MKTDKILFGAAYYDEYLPYDRIETDMEMMERAKINVIRIAESTWSTWEPQEGVFDFTHLHRMLKAAKKHGISVIVGTPSYAIPTWLAAKYPDIITETHAGKGRYGHRQNMDITHPMYLKHVEIIIRKLMEEVSDYDNVIGFQLDNETKAYDTCSKYAQAGFVQYLKDVFDNDLDKLNDEFGLDYWSNRINAWEDFPDIRGTINGSLGAEYQKYQRKLVTDFLAWQSKIVGEYARPSQFITQNFDYEWRDISYGLQPEVNQWEAGRALDVAGFDIYHPSAQDLTGVEISLGGTIARSVKKENYLILETEAQGNFGWLPYPGQLRLQAFSHLASGSNSVMYWHWHSIHNAIESYWKGILSHNLRENTVYHEICRIGNDFDLYGQHLKNLKKSPQVAIVLSHESLNGLQWFPIHNELNYNDILRWIHDALYQLNIECDILNAEDVDLFSRYKVLITPALYSVSDTTVSALDTYVRNGGHLISTFKTAVSDSMLKIYSDDLPHKMTHVFGMTYDQFTNPVNVGLKDEISPQSTGSNNFVSDKTAKNSINTVNYWMELLIPSTAETLAYYDHPYRGEYSAVTCNRYGSGRAFYIGCYFEQSLLKDLLRHVCIGAGIEMPESEYPVIIKRGINDFGREIVYYFNYSDDVREAVYRGKNAAVLINGSRMEQSEMNQSETPQTEKITELKDGDIIKLEGWSFMVMESRDCITG